MSKVVSVGGVKMGGGAPVSIQSMTNTDTKKVRETVEQIKQLEEAGCQIVRCAAYDIESAQALRKIKEQISIPLVADVHFDYKIAVAAIESGVDKIRINPGNIGDSSKVLKVVDAARQHQIPIRVGANAGSLSKAVLAKHGAPTADALVESVMENVRILERANFDDIVVSIKSSSVPVCIEAYRKIARKLQYPLHLGVTEAGTYHSAIIKSAIALGSLLVDGIGDTIRVSITGDPVQEVDAARDILKCAGLWKNSVEIISCPTCARCSLNIEKIASNLEEFSRHINVPLKVAVMGCAVNGPGEAREADIGIAGGHGEALLFSHGTPIKKVDEFDILREMKSMILKLASERGHQT